MSKQMNQMKVRYKSLADGDNACVKREHSLNTILSPGSYVVEIEHSDGDVGLPIDFCGKEHYIVGHLWVTDTGTLGAKQWNRVMGQVLAFTSRTSRETMVFTRTFSGGKWGVWRNLARTGLYRNICTTDELLASVEHLVKAEEVNTPDISALKSIVAVDNIQGSFNVLATPGEKVLHYHSYIKNVKVQRLFSNPVPVDLSSIALCLLRKGSTAGKAEVRWSAVINGERDYIFGENVLIDFTELNSNGYTHIEQDDLYYGFRISYDIDFTSDAFPKSLFVFGSLDAEPSVVVSQACISFAPDALFKKSYNSEFVNNTGYFIKAVIGSAVPSTPIENSSFRYAEIDVSAGQRYIFNCARTAYVVGWAVLDADRMMLAHSGYASSNDDMILNDVDITIPKGAARLLVNILVSYNKVCPKLVQFVEPIEDMPSFRETECVVEELSVTVNEIPVLSKKVVEIEAEIERAKAEELNLKAGDSFVVVSSTTNKVLEYHSYIKNVKVQRLFSNPVPVDLSSIALCLLRKGSTAGKAEVRWSAVINGERDYIFGENVLIDFTELNSNGYTHIEQDDLYYGFRISYDIDFTSDAFPKSLFVFGSLDAEPSVVVSQACISFAPDALFKKSYNSEFVNNTGYFIKAVIGSAVPSTPIENSSFRYAEIDVSAGQRYIFNCARTAYVVGWAVLDADRMMLAHSGYASSNDDMILNDVDITIPKGAARLLVNILVSYNKVCPKLVQFVEPIEDMPSFRETECVVEELSVTVNEIPVLSKKVVEIEAEIIALTEKELSDSVVTGAYIKIKEGAIVPSEPTTFSSASYLKTEVAEGMRFVGTCSGTASVLAWAVADAAGRLIEHSGYFDTWGEPLHIELAIPKNAKYLILNNFSTTTELSLKQLTVPIEDISALSSRISSVVNVLNGKKILCLGDSITEFKGGDGLRYSDYIARFTGATVYNGGIGGAHMEQRNAALSLEPANSNIARAALDLPNLVDAIVSGNWEYQDVAVEYLKNNAGDNNTSIIAELKTVNLADIDIVTIFIGTNDKDKSETNIGAIGDTNPVANSLGGFGHAIEALLTANPNLCIYYFCPMPRYFENPAGKEWNDSMWCDNYVNGSGMPFTTIVDKMIDNARYWRIPVCDMYRTMGVNRFNIFNYAPDGTHPSKGYAMVANKIISFITANNNLNG